MANWTKYNKVPSGEYGQSYEKGLDFSPQRVANIGNMDSPILAPVVEQLQQPRTTVEQQFNSTSSVPGLGI